MTTEDVPRRVLEAEDRRNFREMLARSSLGCKCGHLLSEHDADDWAFDGEPVDRRCRVSTCPCGKHLTSTFHNHKTGAPEWACSTCGAVSGPFESMDEAEKFARAHREGR